MSGLLFYALIHRYDHYNDDELRVVGILGISLTTMSLILFMQILKRTNWPFRGWRLSSMQILTVCL